MKNIYKIYAPKNRSSYFWFGSLRMYAKSFYIRNVDVEVLESYNEKAGMNLQAPFWYLGLASAFEFTLFFYPFWGGKQMQESWFDSGLV